MEKVSDDQYRPERQERCEDQGNRTKRDTFKCRSEEE